METNKIKGQIFGELLNKEIIREKDLVVPHPEIQNRRFALVPLNELSPGLIHPVLNKTIHQLLETCPDTLDVKKF